MRKGVGDRLKFVAEESDFRFISLRIEESRPRELDQGKPHPENAQSEKRNTPSANQTRRPANGQK